MKKNLPSSSNLIRKAFSLSFNNIWRNKFLSIATIFVIGTIIFIFNVILAVNIIAKESINDLNQKIDIVAYIKESGTFQDAQNIKTELLTLEGVTNVTYTSKEQALEKIKTTHPDLTLAFEKYALGNPLPASLNIVTSEPKYHTDVADFLSNDKYKSHLSNVITSSDTESNAIITSVSKNLLKLTNFAHQLIFWLIMIFIVGGTLIILNAIQMAIFNRKKEIEVMKLVGAPYWLIRLPYIIESVTYGIMAVILSFIMLLILSQKIQIERTDLFSHYTQIEFGRIFLFEILATVVLSVLSAILAVHEYIYEKRHS